MEALKIAVRCVIAAILCGIVHDQFDIEIAFEGKDGDQVGWENERDRKTLSH